MSFSFNYRCLSLPSTASDRPYQNIVNSTSTRTGRNCSLSISKLRVTIGMQSGLMESTVEKSLMSILCSHKFEFYNLTKTPFYLWLFSPANTFQCCSPYRTTYTVRQQCRDILEIHRIELAFESLVLFLLFSVHTVFSHPMVQTDVRVSIKHSPTEPNRLPV